MKEAGQPIVYIVDRTGFNYFATMVFMKSSYACMSTYVYLFNLKQAARVVAGGI